MRLKRFELLIQGVQHPQSRVSQLLLLADSKIATLQLGPRCQVHAHLAYLKLLLITASNPSTRLLVSSCYSQMPDRLNSEPQTPEHAEAEPAYRVRARLQGLKLLLKGAEQPTGRTPGGAVGNTHQSLTFVLRPCVLIETRASRC